MMTDYYHVWFYHQSILYPLWNFLESQQKRDPPKTRVATIISFASSQCHTVIGRFAAAVAVARFKRFCNSPVMWERLLGASFPLAEWIPWLHQVSNTIAGHSLSMIHLSKMAHQEMSKKNSTQQESAPTGDSGLWDHDSSWSHCLAKRSSLQSACACLLPSSPQNTGS